MSLKQCFSLIVSLPTTLFLQADFTHVSVWQHETASGKKQLIVLCGDRHDKNSIGLDQAEQIVKLMKEHSRSGDCIIIEDMNDAAGLAKRVDCFFEQHPNPADQATAAESLDYLCGRYEAVRTKQAQDREQASLFLLPYCARMHNIPMHNSEFRQFLSCDAPRMDITKYEKGHEIVPWMLEQIVHEIEQFDDIPLLNVRYAESVKRYKPFMHYITDIMRTQKIIFQQLPHYLADRMLTDPHAVYLGNFESARTIDFSMMYYNLNMIITHLKSTKDRKEYTNDLIAILTNLLDLSAVELIDCVLLHEIYTRQIAQDVDNTLFVCAGQSHTEIVEKMLFDLGYLLLTEAIEEDGVTIETVCEPFMAHIESKKDVSLWSYLITALSSLIAYTVGLFS